MIGTTISHYRILEKNVAQLGRIAPPLAALLLFISAGVPAEVEKIHSGASFRPFFNHFFWQELL